MTNKDKLELLTITTFALGIMFVVVTALAYIMPTPEELIPVAEELIKGMR